MEKLSSFYENLTDRLRSPLIFSFIVSWLIINWRIPICLLWFDLPTLLELGYKSHIAYIESVLGFTNCFLYPLLGALAYTFGYPVVKNWILWYQTKRSKIGEKKRLEISEGSYVAFARYDAKVKKLIQREKELIDFMDKESITIQQFTNEIANQKAEIAKLKRDLVEKNENIETMDFNQKKTNQELLLANNATDLERFQGKWMARIENEKFEWHISKSQLYEVEDDTTFHHNVVFSYWHVNKTYQVILILEFNKDHQPFLNKQPLERFHAVLKRNTMGDSLKGKTAEGYAVSMEKIGE